MIWFRVVSFFLLGALFSCSLFSQPFVCDGNLILATRQDDTRALRIEFGFMFINYNPIATYIGEGFDALGFNPKDNYIYAVQESTSSIVRLRANGTYEVLASEPLGGSLRAFAGDCSPDGLYLCYDQEVNQILVFEVVDGFNLVDRIDLYWDPDTGITEAFTTRLDDFAIDPTNPGVAYSYQGNYNDPELVPLATKGELLQINLDFDDENLGMVTPVAELSDDVIVELGGLFFNANGTLYGYGAPFAGPNMIQNRLVVINKQSGELFVSGNAGPSAPVTDGCSCPYSLSFHNVVTPLVTKCSGEEVDYTITINNRSNESLTDLILTDTLEDGMLIQAVGGGFNGNIDPATGVGTRFLTITDLAVPPKAVVQITIAANIIDLPVGIASNQAYLRNLPPLFEGERITDDPTSSNKNDPTNFLVDAQFLDDVELVITQPTDCLNANDGQVLVSCPLFLVGESYEVGLINEDWEDITRQVVIDANNSFFLDSIEAGAYRLDRVQPQDLQCSFEWKDTTIIVEPPNEQLEAIAESNGPICAGTDLELSATLSPGGTVRWRGPELFASNNLNPIREAAIPEYSGAYAMTATYGACQQLCSLEVVVVPAIDASVRGLTDYCERERMRLKAKGVGENLSFQWSGPGNATASRQVYVVESIAPVDAGAYEVIIDNGICEDTATATIVVLPSPTIELPQVLEADFCDPVFLAPEIRGDADVAYSWMPQEGLSCYDCPRPEVLLPFIPSYSLQVVNDTLCTDSTVVRLQYDAESLMYVPNAFSPNADGVNDRFQLYPSCAVQEVLSLEVFDRWGAIVFNTTLPDPNDIGGTWDGRISGKPALTGTYLWQAKIKLVDGLEMTQTGTVNLLR